MAKKCDRCGKEGHIPKTCRDVPFLDDSASDDQLRTHFEAYELWTDQFYSDELGTGVNKLKAERLLMKAFKKNHGKSSAAGPSTAGPSTAAAGTSAGRSAGPSVGPSHAANASQAQVQNTAFPPSATGTSGGPLQSGWTTGQEMSTLPLASSQSQAPSAKLPIHSSAPFKPDEQEKKVNSAKDKADPAIPATDMIEFKRYMDDYYPLTPVPTTTLPTSHAPQRVGGREQSFADESFKMPHPITTDLTDDKIHVQECIKILNKELKNGSILSSNFQYPRRTKTTAPAAIGANVFTNHFKFTKLPGIIRFYLVSGFAQKATALKKKKLIETMINMVPSLSGNRTLFAIDGGDAIYTWGGLDLFADRPEHEQDSRTFTVQVPSVEDSSVKVNNQYVRQKVWRTLTISHSTDLDANSLALSSQNVLSSFQLTASPGGDNADASDQRSFLDVTVRAMNAMLQQHALMNQTRDFHLFRGNANKIYVKDWWRDLVSKSDPAVLVTHLGFYFTVKPGLPNALLNFNATTSPFWKPQKMSVFRFAGSTLWHPRDFIGVEVQIAQGGRKEPIKQSDGSIIDEHNHYVKKIKGHREVQGLAKVEFLLSDDNFYEPQHLTIIAFQSFRRQIPPSLMDSMLTNAARTGDESCRLVSDGFRRLVTHTPSQYFTMAPTMIQLNVPVLQRPNMRYTSVNASGVKQDVVPGTWNLDHTVQIRRRISPTDPFQLLYIYQDMTENRSVAEFFSKSGLENFHKIFSQHLLGRGINVSATFRCRPVIGRITMLEELSKPSVKASLSIIIFLSSGNADVYAAFREVVDCKLGLKALHLKLIKKGDTIHKDLVDSRATSYHTNLALKLNLKDGNINQRLSVSLGDVCRDFSKVLIIGADVTHPSPGVSGDVKSIAGLVGSLNMGESFGHYGASARAQEGRVEMITELESMMIERLQAWKKYNPGKSPEYIMYFRDGVSESQYQALLKLELPQINAACQKTLGRKIKITMIVTAKRHHVRFYPAKATFSPKDKGRNCTAGTMCDKVVTSPWYQDFYLQAHSAAGVKGTARPTHYFIIKDDMNWDMGKLQNFINRLCYSYMRSVTAVSYATPAYYADRLCDRLRFYFRKFYEPRTNSGDQKQAEGSFDNHWRALSQRDSSNPWHPNLDNTMFFL